MSRSEKIPVITVSLLLVLFVTLITLREWLHVIYIIFLLTPFTIAWIVYNVIRKGEYKGEELEEEKEWGYADNGAPHSVVRNDRQLPGREPPAIQD